MWAPPVHKATGGHGFPYVTLLNYSCIALNKGSDIQFTPNDRIRTVPKLCANESVKTRLLLKTENSNLILRRVSLRRNLRWDSGISVSSSMQYPSECCPFIKTFSYICKSGGFCRLILHIVKVFFASPQMKMWKFS